MALERVGITRKIIPITERKSKRVIYRIADNFYRFWFRYLYPNKRTGRNGIRDRRDKEDL